jgi:hypothetical protein
MQQLRLIDQSTGKMVPTDRLPFPSEAVRVMGRERLARLTTRATPVPGQEASPLNPALFAAMSAEIESRLAQAQSQLDSLAGQVDSLKFPGQSALSLEPNESDHDDHTPGPFRPRAA